MTRRRWISVYLGLRGLLCTAPDARWAEAMAVITSTRINCGGHFPGIAS